jgi:hypothetical protein
MSLRIRTLLMWLLISALPVQGWAASMLSGCGPSHRLQMGHAAAPADVHAHAHHHGATKDHGTAKDLAKWTCSACASCCTAAALPATTLSLQTPVPVAFAAPSAAEAVDVFVTGGPERPPRRSLA